MPTPTRMSSGKQIRVDGLANTVVGVLPPGFRFLSSEARLYFPFSSRPEDRGPGSGIRAAIRNS